MASSVGPCYYSKARSAPQADELPAGSDGPIGLSAGEWCDDSYRDRFVRGCKVIQVVQQTGSHSWPRRLSMRPQAEPAGSGSQMIRARIGYILVYSTLLMLWL